MKVLHLLASGKPGGIEVLCKNIALESKFDNRLCFIFKEGSIYEELVDKNANVISLKKKKYQLISIIKEITDYCKKEQIDIINMHHGGMYCNIIYILLKKYNPQIKFVRFLHGCYDRYTYGNSNNKLNNFLVKIIMKEALNKSDLIISVSKAVEKSFVERFNIENKNKLVIYNGIGENFFNKKVKARKNFEGKRTNIIFIGRIVEEKGIDILIDAINKLVKDGYNILLKIVGDGSERKKLETKVFKDSLEEKIKFVGAQTNVIDWLDGADIFVYPSICEEAFGISVVEAMSRGCIPLVSNRGGLPEVVGYDKRLLFDDKEELIDKLKKIIVNENNIDVQEIVNLSKKFKIENTLKELKNAYDNLINER